MVTYSVHRFVAFAAERRAAVDIDRKAAAPAADAPCSNRSISPARRAHSSKPAARCCSRRMGETDGQTDGHGIAGPILSVFPALIVHSELKKNVHPGFPVAFIF